MRTLREQLAFLFLDVVLDLFRQHLHLGVEELVAFAVAGLDLRHQQLGRVVLDIGFLEQILLDLAFAGRIENLFLDLGVDRKLEADLRAQLLLAALAFRALRIP